MLQIDGTTHSKPNRTSTSHFVTTRTPTHREGVRKRIANLFTSREKNHNLNLNEKGDDNASTNTQINDTSPMRLISPRTTQYDLPTSASKHKTSSLKQRHTKIDGPTSDIPTGKHDAKVLQTIGENLSGADATTARPLQNRNDSGMMGGGDVPSREEALTSHPVGKIEEGSEDEDEFLTPVSEVESYGVLDRRD